MISGRRSYTWSAVVFAFIAVLVAVMAPFRHHLAVATPGLVLVVPVVAGTIAGGLYAGLVAVVAGAFAYDWFFIPPYGTLAVGSGQYWVSLVVYAVVMLIVVRVVDALEKVRAVAVLHETEAKRLFELSELVVEERTVAELLETIVVTVQSVFGTRGVALLLPVDDRLEVVASAGESIPEDELAALASSSGAPVDLGTTVAGRHELRAVSLSTPEHPIGLLVLNEGAGLDQDRELLRTFANHMAIALERAQLRQTALRVGTLQEVDRLRRSLVSAVSHDLRTPLATIKVAMSSMRAPDAKLSTAERAELLGLVEAQADRLDRLVTNLLDMTRIQAGVLEPRPQSVSVAAILEDAVGALGAANGPANLCVELPKDLPVVDVDRLLVGQVFANLLENAGRFAPDGTPVTVRATALPNAVRVTVADRGPGVPPSDRDGLFEMFSRKDAGGRAGLGLAISKAFVEAHGEHIWFEAVPGGGACFAFDLPRAKSLVATS
jgi:two-component system, OmpR family, sensor histidine kinase KdpD